MLTEILQRMKLLLALALFSPSRDRKHQSTFSCRPPEHTTQGIAFQRQAFNSVTRQRCKACRIGFLEGPHMRRPAGEIFGQLCWPSLSRANWRSCQANKSSCRATTSWAIPLRSNLDSKTVTGLCRARKLRRQAGCNKCATRSQAKRDQPSTFLTASKVSIHMHDTLSSVLSSRCLSQP